MPPPVSASPLYCRAAGNTFARTADHDKSRPTAPGQTGLIRETLSGSGRPIPAPAGVARCAAGAGSDPRQHVGELLVVRCDAVVLRRQEPDLRVEML